MAVIILIIDNSYLATLDWVHWTEAAAKAAKIVESRFSVNVRPRMDQQSSHNLLSWAKILTILTVACRAESRGKSLVSGHLTEK